MATRIAWLLTAAFGLGIVLAPTPSGAAALCKTKKGGLVIRDTCKKKDVQVDAQILGALGLQGPPGPAGPEGPAGPSGGGLTVVDASGHDVGIVSSMGTGYYGGTYTNVIKELTTPQGPELFGFGVSSKGFVTSGDDYYGYGTYTTPDCSGAQYVSVDCEYGACDSPPMFTSLSIDANQVGTFSRVSERVHGDFYATGTMSGSTAEAVTAACAGRGNGTIIGAIAPCAKDPSTQCGRCCIATPGTDAAPLHTLDLKPLGLTPPFKLHR